ncbi:MAG: hypothetical protein RLZZ511_2449 [Cyanobacteriota bacterium]|jgi:hypothetical protein
MIVFTLELTSTLGASSGSPTFIVVGTYISNPGLNEGDEVYIPEWQVGGEIYNLKTKVTGIKREAHFADRKLEEEYGVQAAKSGLLMHRIFLEAEDRDAVVAIGETINQLNPK